MKPVISIGNQDFKTIRENNYFYIDKTGFIKEWWNSGDVVTLITRPRRFGKTLNISMCEQFFSNQYSGCHKLFEELDVWKDENFRRLQGTYPVISLSFASVKGKTCGEAIEGIKQILVDLYVKFDFLCHNDILSQKEKEYFDFVKPDMSDTITAMSLHRLSLCMNHYYGKKVLIFLDEYDTPLLEAYLNGYWDELVLFIRRLFNSTFKTNPYLERGLLTGITRITKESIFSDLNNLEVVTTTSLKYETSFGFTENEVASALNVFHLSNQMENVKNWYNGFHFGKRKDIYNPWSITKYLDTGKLGNYWVNTSANSLAGKLIREGPPDIKIAMEDLLSGKQIKASIDEEIIFNQLDENDSAIWSLLLASGYLKADTIPQNEGESYYLSLTNHEIQNMFRKMIQDWFGKSSVKYNDFIKALLSDNVVYMNRFMNQMTSSVFSFFDTGKHPSQQEPERFYHGFVLGLIADSKIDYIITSNRESGFGRYDVLMEPKNPLDNAYVLEFKVHDPEYEKSLEDTVKTALMQINKNNYDALLIARGIPKEKIRHYGFAFEGKKVLIG